MSWLKNEHTKLGKNKYFIFACLVLLFFGQLSAQDYSLDVQTYGIEEGLLHRDVKTVFEDKNGFIWIGGHKGLQRFDGHHFKTWTKADRTGLVYHISTIGQDDEGWLWLWNNDLEHFVFLHPESEEILTEKERFGDDFPIFIKKDNIKNWNHSESKIPVNSKGQLFFGTQDGQIISYDSQNGFQFQKIENKLPIKLDFIDNQDNIWAYSKHNGMFKVNSKGKILNTYLIQKEGNVGNYSFWNEEIYFHFYPEDATISRKLMKIDVAGKAHSIRNLYRTCYVFDGNFWINEIGIGWEIYDYSQTKILHTLKKEDYPTSLFNYLAAPYQDSHGNIWVYGHYGLNKVKFQRTRFQKYFAFDNENDKPFYNAVRGIWVEKDTIFTNFEHTGTVRINQKNPNDWQVINKEQWARPVLRKENGNLWIGFHFFIEVFTPTGKSIQKIAPKKGQIISGIWSFCEDNYEKLWIGGGTGLFFKNKQDSFLQIYKPDEDPFGFTSRRGAIQNMIPAEGDLVWFCSWTGLYLFDTKSEKIVARYASDEEGEFYLPAALFYYLYKDKEGIYWIGTNEGLIRWENAALPLSPKRKPQPENSKNQRTDSSSSGGGSTLEGGLSGGQWQLFSRKDGLSNDVIYAIFEDKHNRLWMSSDYGIMSFNKETFDVKSYLEKDGISHHEFNRTSQFQAEDGTIYFGGLNGITAFHPDDFVQEKKDYAKILISNYEIFTESAGELVNKVGELRQSKTITFYPNDRYFRLEFVLPTFEDASRILYAWKIEGVDSDWNYQKENSIQIGKLPYGNHILHIKGQSASSGWSPHELAIQVNVIKPYYLQTWFILLSIFAMALGVYLFFKRRIRNFKATQNLLEREIKKATTQIEQDKNIIEVQAEELRELDKVKSRFFANISHELRTPLTLMLGPISSILKSGDLNNRNFTLLKKAQMGGNDLLKLVGSVLGLSKMEAGKMELNERPELLFPLARRIISSFESHAQRKGIQFEFHFHAEKNLQVLLDAEKLKIILNNLLSNAIKFTPKGGRLFVEIWDESNHIKTMVNDTGRGIHPNDISNIFNRFYQSSQRDAPTEGGTGIGLALTQEFVHLMNGEIWVESELGEGSAFYFKIPRKEVLGVFENVNVTERETEMASSPEGKAFWQEDILSNKGSEAIEMIPSSLPQSPSLEDATSVQHSNTILIVEDNTSLRDYIQTILTPYYKVLTTENGQAALNLLNKIEAEQGFDTSNSLPLTLKPQLILSDIMMPVMDGFQLLKTLKSKDEFRHIPVIMLTARADIQDKLQALRIGVDDYILKPFVEEELLARIENLLQNYQERIVQLSDTLSKEIPLEEAFDASVKTPTISKEDQEWMVKLEAQIQKHLSNSQYSITQLAYDLAISERQLRRRIKQMIGLSPSQYFKAVRLQHARQLLEQKTFKTVAQTAFAVGFQDPGAFSRNFMNRFGKPPSDYINS